MTKIGRQETENIVNLLLNITHASVIQLFFTFSHYFIFIVIFFHNSLYNQMFLIHT